MKDDATASQETDEERALQWYANAANIVAIPSTDVPLLGLFAREIFRLRKERDEANACAERWMAELNPAAGDSIPPDAPRAGGETPDIDLEATREAIEYAIRAAMREKPDRCAMLTRHLAALRAALPSLLERHRDGERWHATEDDLPMMLNLADECEAWGNTAWATRLREIALNGESFESFQSRRRPSPELRGSIRARHEEAGHLYDRLLADKLKWFEEAAASDRQVHALTDNATLIECLGEIRHFAPSAMHWALNLAMARLAALDGATASEQTND